MSFAVSMLIVEGIITAYCIVQMMEMIANMPDGMIKIRIYRFVTSRSVTFVINFAISNLMTWFTGAGLTAGFANLGSSVTVGFLLPIYLRWKYPIEALEVSIEAKKRAREEYKAAKKMYRKAAKEEQEVQSRLRRVV